MVVILTDRHAFADRLETPQAQKELLEEVRRHLREGALNNTPKAVSCTGVAYHRQSARDRTTLASSFMDGVSPTSRSRVMSASDPARLMTSGGSHTSLVGKGPTESLSNASAASGYTALGSPRRPRARHGP